MKESQRQCIERHLEEFAAWRASGLTLTAYAQQRGEDLALWRGRLTWERRWQQMLAGTYKKPATPASTPATFVKVVAQSSRLPTQSRPAQRTPQRIAHCPGQSCAHEHICLVVSAPGRSDLQANIHWPIDQMGLGSNWASITAWDRLGKRAISPRKRFFKASTGSVCGFAPNFVSI